MNRRKVYWYYVLREQKNAKREEINCTKSDIIFITIKVMVIDHKSAQQRRVETSYSPQSKCELLLI